MAKFALYVPLEAKPGKEKEVADFLRSAVPLVNAEPGTISWYANSGRTILFRDIRYLRRRGWTRRASQRKGRRRVDGEDHGRRLVRQET